MIWSPPRGDSSSWGWVHYAIQLNSQYDHMFKNTANAPFYGSYHSTCGSFGFYISISIYLYGHPPSRTGNEEVCIHRTYYVRRRPTHKKIKKIKDPVQARNSRKSRKSRRTWKAACAGHFCRALPKAFVSSPLPRGSWNHANFPMMEVQESDITPMTHFIEVITGHRKETPFEDVELNYKEACSCCLLPLAPRPWFQILSSYKWPLSKRMMLQSPSSNITSLQTKPSPLTSSPSHVVEGSTSDTSHWWGKSVQACFVRGHSQQCCAQEEVARGQC